MKSLIRKLAAVFTAALLCFNLYYELAPDYVVGPEQKFAFAAVVFDVFWRTKKRAR